MARGDYYMLLELSEHATAPLLVQLERELRNRMTLGGKREAVLIFLQQVAQEIATARRDQKH